MRKWITCAVIFACMTGLAGCNQANPSNPSASGSHEHAESLGADSSVPSDSGSSPSVKPDSRTLDRPPELVVSTLNNADCVTASCGNYQWNHKLPGGSGGSVIACGAHPLDEAGAAEKNRLYTAFPPGTLPPLSKGENTPSLLPEFYLDFGEIPPETVTVRRWPSEYIGRASEFDGDSEEVEVDSSDGFAILPFLDGEFVYEVNASWGEAGSASYVFSTLPQARGEI